MYIKSVLSHFGGWQKLTEQHSQEYQELSQIINDLVLDETFQDQGKLKSKRNRSLSTNSQLLYSTKFVDKWVDKQFMLRGWHPEDLNRRLFLGKKPNSLYRYTELDALKRCVGVDVTFSKFAFAESCIFVKFPIFSQAKRIDIGVLIVPMDDTRKLFQPGVSGFEMLKDRIKALAFLPIKYPLAILGISNTIVENIDIEELTSPLDRFFVENLGLTLSEMKLQTERPAYDFKIELPTESEKVAKEICALANLDKGGYILIGLRNDGDIVGILRNTVDTVQLRISHIAHDNVNPNPEIEFRIFDHPSNDNRCVLVVRVIAVQRKPCIANDRVYVRTGNEAVAAKPDEIRKLVLGSGA